MSFNVIAECMQVNTLFSLFLGSVSLRYIHCLAAVVPPPQFTDQLGTAMGDSLSRERLIKDSCVEVVCTLVTDNKGQFAGLVPKTAYRTMAVYDSVSDSPFKASHDTFRTPVELGDRNDALEFAKKLVAKNKKRFSEAEHQLKTAEPPTGAKDHGLHVATHSSNRNGGPLSQEQISSIQDCKDTFTLNISFENFRVTVGAPSNDDATGVHGYVGLCITPESLREYDRALNVFGGQLRSDQFPPLVSICGYELMRLTKFPTSGAARRAFGLVEHDNQKYPNGKTWYTGDQFPRRTATLPSQKIASDQCRSNKTWKHNDSSGESDFGCVPCLPDDDNCDDTNPVAMQILQSRQRSSATNRR